MSAMNSTNATVPLDPATIAAIQAIFKVELDYRVNQYLTIGSFALLIYDSILTFQEEYEFVWKAKFNLGAFTYLLLKYGYVLEAAASLPYYVWLNPDYEFCKYFFHVDAWASTILSFPITGVLAMRTYALYDRKPSAKWFLVSIFTIELAALIAGETIFTIQAKHTSEPLLIPGSTCVYTLYSLSYAVGIVIFGVSAAYDLSIFLMTALRILRLYRDGRSRLIDVVLRDCLLYFGILFTLNFISFLLYVTIPEDRAALRSLLVTPSRAIAVILVSRILLNLRRVVTTGHITTDTLTIPVSELQWNHEPEPESEKREDRVAFNSGSGSSGIGRTRVGTDSLVFSKTVTTTMSEDIEMR